MDEDTGNVVVFNVNQVSEVSSSNVVEKEGFSPCAKDLKEKGVKVSRIGADRHLSAAAWRGLPTHQSSIGCVAAL